MSKILHRYANVDIVVDLHRHPFAIAFPNTKTPHKHNVPIEMMFFYGVLHQRYNFGRAF